ncbi:BLUF domain-containing protein [Mucilaginibacter aquaedulcis]|uniref:BLUF domain-containing protein n=1 Tax=Mucilaginibacter aquaedulcis TaxID=1187081 RepID=UPI0025B5CD54|nr:BLUF domain-containing protein [Mucilaginibacter aquaedulcis]MDN3549091.1 BLUF domain-containing protein [Mucilaginibacter aquaedulcis]
MEYIVYVSTADTLLTELELVDLLNVARDKNEKYGVTGMLLYCEGTFMQVIEGEADSVNLIYSFIEQDTRHKNIIKLATGKIDQRNFPDWTMGFASINSETLQDIEGYLSSPLSAATGDEHITVNMLKTFADSNKLYISF